MISELEKNFDEKRIFGDERDLEAIYVYKDDKGPNCVIPVRVSYMYPEMQNNPRNTIELSPECVKEALEKFVDLLLFESNKPVVLFRIDVSNTNDFDLSNNAAVMIKSYYEIKEARRTDPKKAREIEQRMRDNLKLIADFRTGKISKKKFQKQMALSNSDMKKVEKMRKRSKEL